MSTIYLFLILNDHEPTDIIRAFSTKKKAESFLGRCKLHDEKKPEPPRLEEVEQAYEAWGKKHASWLRRHPCGDKGGYSDHYHIQPTRLDP